MNGEEMDELRRTSRTVCHRLVTPLPSPPVKVRVVSLSTLQEREEQRLQTKCIGIISSTFSGEESAKRQYSRAAGGPRHPAA